MKRETSVQNLLFDVDQKLSGSLAQYIGSFVFA